MLVASTETVTADEDTTLFPHRASDLCYRFLRGTPDLSPLRILARRVFLWHDWEVEILILGASHALRLRHRVSGEAFTELLTCVPPPEPEESATLFALSVPGNAAALMSFSFRGTVCLERFCLNEQDDHLQIAAHDALSFDFPSAFEDTPTPRTRVGWRIERSDRDSRLVVETVHTYPEEMIGVRSVTVLASYPGASRHPSL